MFVDTRPRAKAHVRREGKREFVVCRQRRLGREARLTVDTPTAPARMVMPGRWAGLWVLLAAFIASAAQCAPLVDSAPAAQLGRGHLRLRCRAPLRVRGGSAFAALEDEVGEDAAVCAPSPIVCCCHRFLLILPCRASVIPSHEAGDSRRRQAGDEQCTSQGSGEAEGQGPDR